MKLESYFTKAKPEFAMKEGVTCDYCHVVAGGPRNFRGMYYHVHNHSFADFDNVFEAKAAGVEPDSKGADAKPTVADYSVRQTYGRLLDMVAEVVKTTSDSYVGRLSLVRVFSGTLRPEQQ